MLSFKVPKLYGSHKMIQKIIIALALLGLCRTALSQDSENAWQPEIQITAPDMGTSYVRGTTQAIRWNDQEVTNHYHKIDLICEGSRTTIAEGYLSSPWQWAIPLGIETSQRYRIRIAVAQDAGNAETAWVSDYSDYFAIIDDASPEVVLPEDDPGGEGAISFTLTWEHNGSDEGPDIDLHVIDPTGNHWDYRNEGSGHFDYDDQGEGGNDREDDGEGPERAYWDGETAIPGEYEFYAHWYSYGHSVTNATNADITLNVFRRQPGGEQKLVATYTDRLRRRNDETPHWTYTVRENDATLVDLEITGRQTVRPGRIRNLRAIATWSNGDRTDVTQFATWQEDSPNCQFERPGRLRNQNDTGQDDSVMIYAAYAPNQSDRARQAEIQVTLQSE